MTNSNTTILVVSFISFVFGMLFMFILNLSYKLYGKSIKHKFRYLSYEKTYSYNNPISHPPITNPKLISTNNLSALEILERNYKQFAVLFMVCLVIGFYYGNLLLQVQMHH